MPPNRTVVELAANWRLPELYVAEVGVYAGATSAALLAVPWVRLTMVDTWRPGWDDEDDLAGTDLLEAREMARQATQWAKWRRRILPMSSRLAAQMAPRQHYHLIYIDADHQYEAVRMDLRWWYPMLRRGGYLCCHDYGTRDGVRRAVDEFAQRVNRKVDYRRISDTAVIH